MGDGPSTSTKTSKYSRNQSKIFNDPIWGPIELNRVCVKIIDTPEFQRLRFIKQLGGCSFVYPGAVHTRFEHSIGTSYLAGCLIRSLKEKLNPEGITIKNKDILCVEIAALCHDLGHGAFSHLFDMQFIPRFDRGSKWTHEDASIKMLSRIFNKNKDVLVKMQETVKDEDKLDLDINSPDRVFIEGLIRGEKKTEESSGRRKELDFLYEIVANEKNKIDVDKWDYFSRDCHMLGIKHNFQIMRSIKLARVIKHEDGYHISFPVSEYMNIFDMYHARYTLHRRAYQHPVNKAVELMITDALHLADERLKYKTVEEKEPIELSKTIHYIDAYLLVTDDVIDRIRFENSEDEKFKEAKEIIERIFRREFYKCEKKNGMERREEDPEEVKNRKITKEQKENNEKNQKEILQLIERKDIYVQPVDFSYGAGKQNPMDGVYFYRGEAAAKPTYDEKSGMIPSRFQETYLRMYWKKSSEKGKDEATKAFKSLYELNLNGKLYSLKCESSDRTK